MTVFRWSLFHEGGTRGEEPGVYLLQEQSRWPCWWQWTDSIGGLISSCQTTPYGSHAPLYLFWNGALISMQVSSCSQLIIKGRKQDASLYILLKKMFYRGRRLIPEVFYGLCTACPWKQQGFKGTTFFSNPTHPRNFCIKRRQGLCFRALVGKKVEYIQLICLTFGECFTVMRAHSRTIRTFQKVGKNNFRTLWNT